MMLKTLFFILGLMKFSDSAVAASANDVPHIPDEYETVSASAIGINNAGVASNDGFSAIYENPALMAGSKQYAVTAGYHWPVAGRDYYQAGVVDSKTAPIAAGFSYTGFTDDFKYPVDANGQVTGASRYDSPITRRIAVAFAQNFGSVAVGLGGTYVDAHPALGSLAQEQGSTHMTGFGLNAGIALPLGTGLNFGASVSNISNQKLRDYDPRTFRAGLAYQLSQMFTAYLDARQRDRVPEFEDQISLDDPSQNITLSKPERLVIGSLMAQIQDYLRLMGSYGQSLTDSRRMLSGGASLVAKNFSLSYTAERPYMKIAEAHQAVSLTFDMNM